MCQNCKPIETSVDSVELPESGIVPHEYHAERKLYSLIREDVSDTCWQSIQDYVVAWVSNAQRNARADVPSLESITQGINDSWYYPADCVKRWANGNGVHLPYAPEFSCHIVRQDTEAKTQANIAKRAKQLNRLASDAVGAIVFDASKSVALSRISALMDSVGKQLRDEKRQTIPKRFAKQLHTYGIKLSMQQVETIGNIVTADAENQELSAFVAFDNDYIGAHPDDYCNDASCWFGDGNYSDSPHMLHNAGGYALRTYASEDDDTANGRVWIAPLPNNRHLIFNDYADNMTLKDFADLLAKHWGTKATRVKLYDHHENFYINSNLAYLIGDPGSIDDGGGFSWSPRYVCNPDRHSCEDCGRSIDCEDCSSDPDGNMICHRCYERNYRYCSTCEHECGVDDMRDCGGESMCESCAERNGFRECADCDTWSDDLTELDNGNCICDSCLESYTCCEDCSEYFDSSECEECEADGCQYCSDCMPELEGEQYCQATGEMIDSEDIGSGWQTERNSRVLLSHCPVLSAYGAGVLPVRSECISDLSDRVNRGDDVTQFSALATLALSLCLAGF